MHRARQLLAALAVVLAGVVLGSGIAGFALMPANDACSAESPLAGPALDTDGYALAPFGTRCATAPATGPERVVVLGPSVPAWIAWMVAMTALCALAARQRHGSRAVAGALAAAVVLALAGVAAHGGTDFVFTFWMVVYVGAPLALVTRHLWLPREERAWARSAGVTLALVPTVFVAGTCFVFVGGAIGHLGGVLGLAAGAAVSAHAHRLGHRPGLVGEPV